MKLLKFTFILMLSWTLNLLVFEVVLFRVSAPRFNNLAQQELQPIHNIVIIGDPQLTDVYSYPIMQGYPKTYISRFIAFLSDLYMRKNFASMMQVNVPDVIVFMGDVFDGGRFLTDSEYDYSLNRYRSIFHLPKSRSTIPVIHLAGNHDINLGNPDHSNAFYFATHLKHVIERHERHFGPVNQVFSLPEKTGTNAPKFKLVSVNSPFMEFDDHLQSVLSREMPTYAKTLEWYHNQTWSFIEKELNHVTQTQEKLVLFSHIPLYRSSIRSECGRYSTTRSVLNKEAHIRIKQGMGSGYQNLVNEENTYRLLSVKQAPNIVRILSGDDHSNCEHSHRENISQRTVIENTVGTFSFMQGAVYPSVGMLQTMSDGSVRFDSKFLLPQWYIYIWYLICAASTIMLCMTAPLYLQMRFVLHGKNESAANEAPLEEVLVSSVSPRQASPYEEIVPFRRRVSNNSVIQLAEEDALEVPSVTQYRTTSHLLIVMIWSALSLIATVSFSIIVFMVLSLAWFII